MKITTMLVTDDLDGAPDAETQLISFNGSNYEIDLGEANITKLHELLTPYLEAGRRVQNGKRATKTPGQRRGPTPGSGLGSTAAIVRAWWAKHPGEGLPSYQTRGAIPSAVLRAWEQRDVVEAEIVEDEPVEEDPAPAPKPRRTRKPKAAAAAK